MRFTTEEIDSENTWQIGTGDDTRMYYDIFFKYGVALVGPGDPGKEGEFETTIYYQENGGNNWGATLKQIKKGEWIIARKGKGVIIAIGEVEEEYNYSNHFDDVEGWDLQHFIKVRWFKPKTEDGFIWLDNYVLSQSTLQRCRVKEVYETIYAYEFEEHFSTNNIDELSIPDFLTANDINNALVDYGVRIQDAENIGATLQRIIRLADWYVDKDGATLESELVTFLVVPFLIALGWSEQKIKLEYNNIDVAIFKEAFIGNYNSTPHVILEAKKFNNGLAFTDKQIDGYSGLFPDCKKFVTTNGFRYKYFEKENGKLICKGAFNLRHLKEKDVLYEYSLNTIETILAISNF